MNKILKRAPVLLALTLSLLPAQAMAYTQKESIVNSGHGSLTPTYLVIHETANPGASAYNHMLLYSRGYQYAVQYVMELDGSTVYHTMRDDRLAWAVGNGNPYCVNIELAHATSSSDFAKQWTQAVAWTGDYLRSRGWGIDRLICHNEARIRWGGTTHTDPLSYFATYGKTWTQFKQAVVDYMSGGKEPTSPETGGSTGAQQTTQSSTDVHIKYRSYVPGYGWQSEITDFGAGYWGYSGLTNRYMSYISMGVTRGQIRYRVHTQRSGWLAWITRYDVNDLVYGCAGDGSPIDGLQVYYRTNSGEPWKQAYYRSSVIGQSGYLDVCCDDGTTYRGFDGWAGLYNRWMDQFQLYVGPKNPFK